MQKREVPNNRSSGETPIVLTTDFGLIDSYVGVMKGVVLGVNPEARIIDLTHQIQPQNILQASFTLSTAYHFFPNASVHAVVVDPGVGTDRRAILLVTPHGRFLAPDNGVLSGVLANYDVSAPVQPGLIPVPDGLTAYRLVNPSYWLEPVSQTFHGRDVFAPVAAHLSLGVEPGKLGEPIKEIVWLPTPSPIRRSDSIKGEIIVVDHFGNLVSNITGDLVSTMYKPQVEIKNRRISGLSLTFHDSSNKAPSSGGNQLVALLGSNGYLEVALPDGSAASFLGVGVGEPLRLVDGD